MKICLNLRDQNFKNTKSIGIFNVAMGLAKSLALCDSVSELVILSNSSLTEALLEISLCSNVEILGDEILPLSRGQRLRWDQHGLVKACNATQADWLILPKGFPPLLSWPKAKVCCYIHDNIFKFYAEMGWSDFSKLERFYFSKSYRRALLKADLVVTNSEFTCDEVKNSGRKSKVETIGIGFDDLPTKSRSSERCGILIFTSQQPHKLTNQAIMWLRRWKKETGTRIPVFGVGGMPRNGTWPDEEDWIKMPRISDKELDELRTQIEIVVYFSAYEGFGMPPCEALICGALTLASDIPAHRENLPGVSLFSNDSYDSFVEAIEFLLTEKPEHKFDPKTWQEIANSLLVEMQSLED